MTYKPKDGGSAFPIVLPTHGGRNGIVLAQWKEGMALRDWFAGNALAHASPKLNPFSASLDENRRQEMENVAKQAYAYADAMLRAREVDVDK